MRPGDIASYVQDFDRLKVEFDFAESGNPNDVVISLRGPDRSRSIAVDLTRAELTVIFEDVAGPGLRAIKATLNRIRKFGKDFAVWGRGGTLNNMGFHTRVTKLVTEAQKRSKSITIRAAFASQQEEDHSYVFYLGFCWTGFNSLMEQVFVSSYRGCIISSRYPNSNRNRQQSSYWAARSLQTQRQVTMVRAG